jgi:hypothetical protein
VPDARAVAASTIPTISCRSACPAHLPFLSLWLLFPIFLLLILTLGSRILILLRSPSHQGTDERARPIKIIRWGN